MLFYMCFYILDMGNDMLTPICDMRAHRHVILQRVHDMRDLLSDFHCVFNTFKFREVVFYICAFDVLEWISVMLTSVLEVAFTRKRPCA